MKKTMLKVVVCAVLVAVAGWAAESRTHLLAATAAAAPASASGLAGEPGNGPVEVKIDNGPWIKATLDASKSAYTWRFWHLAAPLTPGEHTVTSRAIDTAGKIQPAMDDPIIANKKTYWESNGQITRHVNIT